MENVNKKYKVIISDQATQMLLSHSRFLAQVSEQASINLINEFERKALSLEIMPQRNQRLEKAYLPSGKYYKLLMGKWYLLVYQIKNNTVYIDYVIDCRRDYHWLI